MKTLNSLLAFCLLYGICGVLLAAEETKEVPIANDCGCGNVTINLNEASTPSSAEHTAATPTEFISDWYQGDHLTGDFAGVRPKLEKRGIDFNITYLGNLAANPFGGKAQGATTTNSTNLGMSIDIGELTGCQPLKGFKLNNTWVWRTGESLTKNFIGNQFNVQQNFGAQTIKLQALNISKTQNLFDDALSASMKIGRFAAGEDFLSKPVYGLYMNNSIDGNPVGVFNQTKWSAYPGSCWAVMGEVKTDGGKYLRTGVYQINSDIQDSNDRHGLDFSFYDGIGVNLNNELGWDIHHDDSGCSPGNISFGIVSDWYDAERIDDSGQTRPYNSTFYWQADYMILNLGETCRTSPCSLPTAKGEKYRRLRGLTLWGVAQWDPYENLATMPLFLNGGASFNAPLACRPDDSLSFGIAWGQYSYKLTGKPRGMSEMMLELNYKAQINRFIFLQPVMQYIINPQGGEYPDAMVLGMQFGMDF